MENKYDEFQNDLDGLGARVRMIRKKKPQRVPKVSFVRPPGQEALEVGAMADARRRYRARYHG